MRLVVINNTTVPLQCRWRLLSDSACTASKFLRTDLVTLAVYLWLFVCRDAVVGIMAGAVLI